MAKTPLESARRAARATAASKAPGGRLRLPRPNVDTHKLFWKIGSHELASQHHRQSQKHVLVPASCRACRNG